MAGPRAIDLARNEGPTREGRRVLALEGEAAALADRLPELAAGSRCASPRRWRTASTAAAAPAPARPSGSSANSSRATARTSSTGAARRAPITSMCASASGRRRTRFWLWPDLSPSMDFRSHLAPMTKRDRALVLMLAAAELLVRGGERVALLGLTQPTASRNAATRIAETLVTHADAPAMKKSLPPKRGAQSLFRPHPVQRLPRARRRIRERLEGLASGGVTGHLIQVLDPAEETLPYEGRIEFLAPRAASAGSPTGSRALRPKYHGALRGTSRRARGNGSAPRLVVPRASHRPARIRAAAVAAHAAAGIGSGYRWKRRVPDATGRRPT